MKALILLGHGARDPDWAGPLMRVLAALRSARPDLTVETAFLEFMAPTLEDAVAALAADGASRISVVPVFLAQGGHLKRDLPARLDVLRRQYPDCDLWLATAVGEAPEVIAAIAAHASAQIKYQ
ncbi:MAG: CbiX/SirB N-terminal domain-containing protein, partial [Azoarcus sp.]|nr:CbiX/SirB N-terminal domain-containing protein [Azoarcus sp.]